LDFGFGGCAKIPKIEKRAIIIGIGVMALKVNWDIRLCSMFFVYEHWDFKKGEHTHNRDFIEV